MNLKSHNFSKALKIFTLILCLSGTAVLFQNCSGQGFTSASAPSSAPGGNDSQSGPNACSWSLMSSLAFTFGSGISYDLAATLPSCAIKGGTFDFDQSGANLPLGMTLSANGMLNVGSAVIGDTMGVVFNYTEP